MRIPWNEDEAIILVDAFYQYKNGKIKKSDAVRSVSEKLRRLATSNGIEIDEIFRNQNGIAMQMATLEHIFSNGSSGLRSGSKLFKETMKLYVDDLSAFNEKKARIGIVSEKMSDIFTNFLLSRFEYGIRVNSPIEIMRLRRFYYEDFGEECPWSDEEIKENISKICFFHDEKGFVITENAIRQIDLELDELKKNSNLIVYYEELFGSNEEWFCNLGIFSSEMLKSFLKSLFSKINCKKSYFSWDIKTENELLKENILTIWGNSVLRDYYSIKTQLEYVPIEKIKYALANNSCFFWNSAETYTCENKFIIGEDETRIILDLVNQKIKENETVSFDDMPLERIFEENYELSETAIFSLVFDKILSSKYERTNRAVILSGQETNSMKIMENFCKSKKEITVEELFEEWEIKTGTHRQAEPLEAAYSTMIRVDENRFVSDQMVSFNEAEIDSALDSMVLGDAIGMKEVTSFAMFPECNFQWNLYILESFCRRYSNTFKYMAVTTNSRNAGAIVRKECTLDYHNLLAHVLNYNNVNLAENDVMDYLFEHGFIARHSYKNIAELIELASGLNEGR